jgi:hypothetical protein
MVMITRHAPRLCEERLPSGIAEPTNRQKNMMMNGDIKKSGMTAVRIMVFGKKRLILSVASSEGFQIGIAGILTFRR